MALLEKIKSEEIEFMEMFHNPIALIEVLFSNFDNLQEFDEDKFGDLRTYQYPLISFEPIIDTNLPNITQKEKFNLRKNVGDCVAFGARRFGKSLCVLKLDMPISMLHDDGWGVACTSLDSIHLDGILDSVRDAIENHPILKLWKKRIIKSPRWKITALNNWNLLGINMNLNSKNPGNAWFGKHVKKIYIEEASFETEKIYGNRQDALSELGAVVRTSGMCNFTKSSPAGKTFYALENRSKVVNLPQFVNPFWGEKEKENRLKEFGGENSINYRVFVKGEVVEDGISAFDMDRVKLSYNEKKVIKRFEITKENYGYFENLIVVERPKNAERLMIAADIGESAGSEIIILSEVGDKFNYLYNITLYNLTDEEQYEIFKWLIGKLEANVVALDCGDGSIDKEEFVLLKRGNNLEYHRGKELPKLFSNNKKIYALTKENNKLIWKESKLFQHPYKGKMLRFFSYPGNYNVRVTPNHSMMVYTSKGLIQKRAEGIKIGDWILSPKWKKLKFSKKYLELEYIQKRKNGSSPKIKETIILKEELGYLLGWAVAEGCSKTTSYQFCLGNDEHDKAVELLNLHKKLFHLKSGHLFLNKFDSPHILKGKIIRKTAPTEFVVFGGGKGNLDFFENLCGKGSHFKKVPFEILNSPKSVQKEFLRGLLEGDGHIRKRGEKKSRVFQIKVASEILVYSLIILLQRLGKYPSVDYLNEFGLNSYVVRWSENPKMGKWNGVPYEVIPMKNGKARRKKKILNLKALIKFRPSEKKLAKFKELLNLNWNFKKITKIEKYDYNAEVYDLMVKDNNTFTAGMGQILVHNTGRAVYRRLEKIFSKDNLVWYDGSKKINIDFEKDDKGNILLKSGVPIYRQEIMAEWSVRRLKALLYEEHINIPLDYKLHNQLSSVISMKTGTRTIYRCISEQDHLFDAFRVFAIAEWLKKSFNDTPKMQTNYGTGISTRI